MSKVSPAKRQHKSMRGKKVDMDLLRKRNELTPAVGNAKVNARGDELGPGGQIIRKREEIVQEHYSQAGKARPDSPTAEPVKEAEAQTTTTAPKTTRKKTTTKKAAPKVEEQLTAEEQELLNQEGEEEQWIEDANGDFVKKGE